MRLGWSTLGLLVAACEGVCEGPCAGPTGLDTGEAVASDVEAPDTDRADTDVVDTDVVDTDACRVGQVRDCAAASRVGQGFCDDGTVYAWGSADFDCVAFGWDGGDCAESDVDTDACGVGQVRDCASACAASARVGQGFCDDGTVYRWGSADFDCAEFGWDGGDCRDPDTDGETDSEVVTALPDTGR